VNEQTGKEIGTVVDLGALQAKLQRHKLGKKDAKRLHKLLVRDAKSKPVRRVLQVDAIGEADMDVVASLVGELRRTDIPVRVQIVEGTCKHDVVQYLTRMLTWLAVGYEELVDWPTTTPEPDALPAGFVESDDIPF